MRNNTSLLSIISAIVLFAMPVFAGDNTLEYEDGLVKKALANGETVFVDYAADWCGTCKRQERVIEQLRSEYKDYNKKITFVRVDWDMHQSDAISTSRNIPRRSTLILLKGEEELGRIVAGTSVEDIKGLMDKGL